MNSLSDEYGRTFKTLRVSLNNTCNLACSYCVDSLKKKSSKETFNFHKGLSTSNYLKIIDSLHRVLNLETIRLTGGEPILYKELIPLIKGIKKTGIINIKMTTNGTLLENNVVDLQQAGLTSVNISLDAMDEDVSFDISKRNKLQQTLAGINKALEAGIQIKINCVVMKGVNDNQIMKLFEYSKERNITIRFLELMQMGHLYHHFDKHFYSEERILKTISAYYGITTLSRDANSTSKYWVTGDGYKFGIIANESSPFCNDCNRLRLDSHGNIYGCLSDNHPIQILDVLNNDEKIRERLMQALLQKKTKFSGSELSMLHIGG